MAVTILSIIQVLIGVVLIVFVLGQSGKHSGLGMISGTSDSFLSKNKGKSGDAKLARWTKWSLWCSSFSPWSSTSCTKLRFSECPSFWRGILC